MAPTETFASVIATLRRATGYERTQSVAERRADAWVHIIAIGLTGPAMAWLFWEAVREGTALMATAVAIYGAAAIVLFVTSFAYHHLAPASQKSYFRAADLAAIFVMIAGTYTPYCLVALRGWIGWAMLFLIWATAIWGAVSRLRFPERSHEAPVWPYLAMGWFCIPLLGVLIARLEAISLTLLLLGGAAYTIGVVFHLWESLKFQNSIWHLFVLTAAILHYFSIRIALGLS